MIDDKIETYQELEKRVERFHMLALPGQPLEVMIHTGTSHLVSDLWRFIQSLVFENEK